MVASEKGVVVGRLTFREDGDVIDCQRMGVGGKAIPPNVDKVHACCISIATSFCHKVGEGEGRYPYKWYDLDDICHLFICRTGTQMATERCRFHKRID